MCSRFAQKHIFVISGLYFWPLGSQKYTQERPGRTFKIPKAQIFSPQSHQKTIKSGHWTSKVILGTPKAPKIDEKVTPDTSRSQNITRFHTELSDHLMEKCRTNQKTAIKTHALNWSHRCRQTSKNKAYHPQLPKRNMSSIEARRCRVSVLNNFIILRLVTSSNALIIWPSNTRSMPVPSY